MDAQFLENLCNVDRTVCGYALKPFSAAHLAALQIAESPLAETTEETKVTPGQLLLAAKICSRAIVMEHGAWLPRGLDRIRSNWRDRLWEIRLLRSQVRRKINRESRFEIELRKWFGYRADYFAQPNLMQKEEGLGNYLSADPLGARVILGLRLGLSEERAWSMPYGLLLYYTLILGEIKGAEYRFFNEGDELTWAEQDRLAQEEGRRLGRN